MTHTTPTSSTGRHRRFLLQRDQDPSGKSGTGAVAEGVEFSDSTVVLRWMASSRSTAVWQDLDTMLSVHGHGGLTWVEYLD